MAKEVEGSMSDPTCPYLLEPAVDDQRLLDKGRVGSGSNHHFRPETINQSGKNLPIEVGTGA